MKLFEVDDTGQAVVNKPWLSLIPEFQELFRNSQNKILYSNPTGRKYITYIYFMWDFSSPLREWDEPKRHEEAMYYSGLTDEEFKKPKLKDAIAKYKELQINACRALKSYRAAQAGLDKMDEYFENIDFTQKDKQGKLLYTPNQYIDNISKTNKAYDELEKLATRVTAELVQSTGIRGNADLGDRELLHTRGAASKTESEWNTAAQDNAPTTFVDLVDQLMKHSK